MGFGKRNHLSAPTPAALKMIAVHKRQFEEAGLSDAFTRVIGLVAPLDQEDVLIWRVTQSLKAYHAACNL